MVTTNRPTQSIDPATPPGRPTRSIEIGTAALASEARRITDIKAAATAPASVGPEIVAVAPARGAFKTFEPFEMVPGSTERARRTGWKGRSAMRRADAFDVMASQAARRKASTPPFTAGQISAGRDYGALVERIEAAGVRCSSMESLGRGSGGQGSFSDALLADSNRLAALRVHIGRKVALRAQITGPKLKRARRTITDRKLLEMVCIADLPLSKVLKAHGWSASTRNLAALRSALCASLDRIQGY